MFIKVPLSNTLDDDHTLKNARSSCAKVVEAYDKGVVAAAVAGKQKRATAQHRRAMILGHTFQSASHRRGQINDEW